MACVAANPDELKKEDLLKYLEEKENPLPGYMIDILKQVATGTSYKTVLHEEMKKYSHLKTKAANSIIRSILNSETVDYTDLRNWLSNLENITADRQIINSYIDEGSYAAAITLAQSLNTKYNLSGAQLEENEAYLDCLDIVLALVNSGRNYSDLNPAELSLIDNIASSNLGYASTYAKSIKTMYSSIANCDCPTFEDNNQLKNKGVNFNNLASDYGFNVSVNPNPAVNWAAFKYTLPGNNTTGLIEIRDISGKVVKSITLNGNQGEVIWDAAKNPAGQYVYYVTSGGYNLSGKIILTK